MKDVKKENPDLSNSDRLGRVNSSGFVLQLAIENEIKVNEQQVPFRIYSTEFGWTHPVSGSSGYIDMILGYEEYRMVIECKRHQHSELCFLVSDDDSGDHRDACLIWTHDKRKDGKERVGAFDYLFDPPSWQSGTCIAIDTKRSNNNNFHDRLRLLENAASQLVESTEAFAFMEFNLPETLYLAEKVYIPVIVTTTELFVCRVDSTKINLKNGVLESAEEFMRVPFVRFHKSLVSAPYRYDGIRHVRDLGKAMTRTVFVVNSANIIAFLSKFNCEQEPDNPFQSGKIILH